MPTYEYACKNCGVIEIFHGILETPREVCPDCGADSLERLISGGGAVIMKGKQANQYNDIKAAKYWRDNNGNRHLVTSSDGSSHSPTVSRQITASPEEIAAKKRRDAALDKKRRTNESYARFVKRVKR